MGEVHAHPVGHGHTHRCKDITHRNKRKQRRKGEGGVAGEQTEMSYLVKSSFRDKEEIKPLSEKLDGVSLHSPTGQEFAV